MLPGGDDAQRNEMRRTLESAHEVVDTDSTHQLSAFLDDVRRIGERESKLDV
jgi:hypothetical protein